MILTVGGLARFSGQQVGWLSRLSWLTLLTGWLVSKVFRSAAWLLDMAFLLDLGRLVKKAFGSASWLVVTAFLDDLVVWSAG